MKSTKEHDLSKIEHGQSVESAPWTTPTLVCFGAVGNLTAAGSDGFNETFTSVDPSNSATTTLYNPDPTWRA